MNYKFIDLFCGMGGVRRGFELANCKCVLSADIDKRAIAQYKYLYGEDPTNDVTSREFKDKCLNTDFDILCGGFPCQSFSYMGDMKGFLNKVKGTLFFDCAEILKENRPKAFFFENVFGLLTHDKGKTFNTIFQTLNELNYKLVGFTDFQQYLNCVSLKESRSILRNTFDFGIPQNRQRIYIVGFDWERYGNKLKDFYELPKKREKQIFSVEDIIKDTPEEEFYFNEKSYNLTRKREKKHQKKYFEFPLIKRRYNCITTKLQMMRTDLIPYKDSYRYLAPSELARLQGFKDYAFVKNGKDEFSFEPSLSMCSKVFILGNSVSIPVIEEIAKFIVNELNRLDLYQ